MKNQYKIKSILIIEPSLSYHPLSRFSAVASVLYSMAELLHQGGYKIWMNEYDFDDLKDSKYSDPAMKAISTTSWIKKNLPEKVKGMYRDYKLSNHHKQLTDKLKNNPKPDLILSFVNYGARVGADLAKHWNTPLFSVFDGPIADEYKYLQGKFPPSKNKIDKAEQYNVNNSQYALVYSTAMKEYLEKKVNHKVDAVIHQLVDDKRLQFVENKTYNKEIKLAYIGSFLRWHNVDMLIRVFERLRNDGYKAKLALLGTGQEFDKMKALVEESKYKSEIKFTGFIDGEKLKEELKTVDIGVISGALWYHAPVKFFQYAAAKLAIVATGTPTISEFSEGYPAFSIFKDNDENDLYLKLKALFESPDKIPQMAADGQNFVRNKYSKEKNLALYRNAFEKIEAMQKTTVS